MGQILLEGRGRGLHCTRLALRFVLHGKTGNTSIYVHLFKIFVQHAIVRRFHYLGYKQRFLGGAARAESVRHDNASILYFVY